MKLHTNINYRKYAFTREVMIPVDNVVLILRELQINTLNEKPDTETMAKFIGLIANWVADIPEELK